MLPFNLQLGPRETPHASLLEAEAKLCPRRNQTKQLGFDAGYPLSDMIQERTNSLAVVESEISCFFVATAAERTINRVYKLRSVIQAPKEQRVPCKREPRAQFQCQRTSSMRGSEAELTIRSFRGRERSPNQGRFRRALRHSRANGALPLGLSQPSALVSDLRL